MILVVWKIKVLNCLLTISVAGHSNICGILIVVFSWDVIRILKYGLATLHEENICFDLISQIIMYLVTV